MTQYIGVQNILTEGAPFHPDDFNYGKRPSDEWYIKQSVGYLNAHPFLEKDHVYFERDYLADKIWEVKNT